MHKFFGHFFYRAAVLAGFTSIFLLPVSAATRYDDMTLQVSVPVSSGGESTFGYMDYRVTLSNSGTIDHTVKLILPHNAHGYGNHIRRLMRQVTVPAGSSATVSLLQPPLRMNGDGIGVVIDGRYQQEVLSAVNVNHCQIPSWKYSEHYCILLSRHIGFDDVNKGLEQAFNTEEERRSSYRTPNNFSLALSEFPVSEWSQDWLSYSRFHGIVLSANEWNTLASGVKGALLEYVRCGGNLCVAGPARFDEKACPFVLTEGLFRTAYPGFGTLMTTSRQDINTWGKPEWQLLKDSWEVSSRSLQQSKGIKEANDWFPVIENLSIPVRGLLLIVLIFAVLIGPANLFFLSRKKRQIWLFWTVPLLSVIASVTVFGYAAFSEGWKGFTRVQSLTILDESENLASSIGIAAYYCPLTPQDGLHFEYETECTPQVNQDNYYREGTSGRTVNWTSEQHLSSGWVTARIPSHFLLRKSQMRREKLVFSETSSGQCEVLNGFGTSVESLYYADGEGTVYNANNIAPGSKILMQRVDSQSIFPMQNNRTLRILFMGDWHWGIDALIKEPIPYLQPNCYIALIKEPLFIEQSLHKSKTETFESVVYGICQGGTDAG